MRTVDAAPCFAICFVFDLAIMLAVFFFLVPAINVLNINSLYDNSNIHTDDVSVHVGLYRIFGGYENHPHTSSVALSSHV